LADTDPAAEALRSRLTARAWRVLRTGAASGRWNMALDEALLELAAREEVGPTLRFYAWDPPALSLGRFQGLEGIDTGYLECRGWDLVRRPTGGRAVLHHLELTYSLTLPPSAVLGAGVRTSYSVLVDGLNRGLRALLAGLPAPTAGAAAACDPRLHRQPNCFALASECDSLVPEGKLVGSAQVRRGGALLQHGSILLDADPEAWTALLGSTGRLVTLRALLGEAPSPEQVAEAVLGGFGALGVRLEPGSVSPEEEELARALSPAQS